MGRINQRDLQKAKGFKYKGKLVPLKGESFEADMLKKDIDY